MFNNKNYKLESLKFYKEYGYNAINEILRKIKNTNSILDSLNGTQYKEYKNHIVNIDSLFSNNEYRYLDDKPLYRGFTLYYDIDKEKYSEEYGYISTSKDIKVTEFFAGKNCCILKFYLPDNIKSIEMSKTNILEGSEELEKEDLEKEVLLERNIEFTNIKKIGIHETVGNRHINLYAATVQKLSQLSKNDVYKYAKMIEEEKKLNEKKQFDFEEEKRLRMKKMLEEEDDIDFD